MTRNHDNTRKELNSNDSCFSDELLELAQCLMPEPPSAKVRRVGAQSLIDRRVHEIAWTAYDSAVDAANGATNRLFGSPAAGNAIGGAIEIVLRWQRWNAAVAGAFFAALWPAIGLPTASDVEAMWLDVQLMREELRDAVAKRDAEKPPVAAAARKSSAYQLSAWPEWPGAAEVGKDVGH